MPINLIDYTDAKEGEKGIAMGHLCDDTWEMPEQITVLEKWLKQNKKIIKKGNYVADIGFSPRDGAAGGTNRLERPRHGPASKNRDPVGSRHARVDTRLIDRTVTQRSIRPGNTGTGRPAQPRATSPPAHRRR